MDRALPKGNKPHTKRLETLSQELHEFKLKTQKSTLNRTPPPSFKHLKSKTKRNQLLEGDLYLDKYTEIERENRILYEKMYKIHSNVSPIRSSSTKRSLNYDFRKKQMKEIERENHGLLKRLQEKESSYKVNRFENDRKNNEKLLQNLCEYPYILGVGGSPSKILNDRYSSTLALIKRSPRRLEPLYPGDHRVKVFMKGRVIENKNFIIEIRSDHRSLLVMAYNVEDPEKFSLEISYKEAKILMSNTEDYDKLASMVRLEDNELVLTERVPQESLKIDLE